MASFLGVQPGDRVIVSNSEFADWKPMAATVIKLGIRFPDSPPHREKTIMVRLDEHPFPKVFASKMRDFGWGEDHPTITMERE